MAVIVFSSCSPGPPGPGIDVDHAMFYVRMLENNGPRPGDSGAASFVRQQLEFELMRRHIAYEESPVGGVDLPAIEVLGAQWRAAHHVDTNDPNLLVRFGPPGKALLIMAHYDTVPGSPGAADNGAAVAVLFEIAVVLHEHPPAQPVILAFTANEEVGLVGSEALAAKLAGEIDFAIALDLIGGSGPLVINGASTLIGRAELAWIADAASDAGVAVTAPPVHRVISRWWPQAERSDHGPFTRRGVRAVHFYHRGQDGERIDLAYHSPRDVAARVDRASVDELGRLLVALAAAPPPAHAGDGFWVPATRLVAPRWAVVALELALAAAALVLLWTLPRREPGPGVGLAVAIGCYAVAVALAIGVERAFAGDHPAPWLHAPLRAELAEAALAIGALYLMTRLIARRATWTGDRRYLATAVIALVVPGVAWLAVDAPELAWVWLVPAVAVALAPRLPRAVQPAALAAALLPPILVLAPSLLREAAFNGFLPYGLPLAAWIALLGAPTVASGAWWARRAAPGALGSVVLAVGCGLAVISGVVALAIPAPACTAAEFHRFQLSCEQVRAWP